MAKQILLPYRRNDTVFSFFFYPFAGEGTCPKTKKDKNNAIKDKTRFIFHGLFSKFEKFDFDCIRVAKIASSSSAPITERCYLVPKRWYLVPKRWYLVSERWYLVPERWYLVPERWYLVLECSYLVLECWYLVLERWHLVPNVGTWSPSVGTWSPN